MSWTWRTWDWDITTILWALWFAYFIALETLTLLTGSNEELTEHLRPVFLSAPITWFIGVGIWLWLGFHFFLEAGHPIHRIGAGS